MKLKDMARELNVSVSTISRVLSNDETLKIKDSTKSKIINFALKNGIEINTKKKIDEVLIITNYKDITELDDPYYLNLRIMLENELTMNSFKFKIKKYKENIKLDKYNILIGSFNEKQLEYLNSQNKYIILCDSYTNIKSIDCVTFDYKNSVKSVLDKLYNLNHRKIAFIGGKEKDIEDFRQEYYVKFMLKNNLYNEDLIYIDKFNSKTGYDGILSIFSKIDPTAIFVANDNIAIGCYKALKELNKNVPDDVSIIGFNDLDFSEFMLPSLTSVHIYTNNIIKETVKLLIEQYNKKKNYSKRVLLDTTLIIRDSITKNEKI